MSASSIFLSSKSKSLGLKRLSTICKVWSRVKKNFVTMRLALNSSEMPTCVMR